MAYDIGPKIGIEGEAGFRQAINGINTNLKTLGTEMLAVTSQFDKNEKSTESLTAKNVVLNKQIDEQTNKLSELEKGLKASADKYGENDKVTQGWRQAVNKATADLNGMQRELKSNTDVIENAKNPTDNLAEGISDIGKNADKSGEQVLGLGDIIKGNLIADAIVVGVKMFANTVANLGNNTFGFINDSTTAMNSLITKTGATKEEFSSLEQTMKDIYNDNFGESIEDVADSMAIVRQQTGLAGEELKNTTEQALLMRDTFDMDVNESVRSAQMMMDQFGLSSKEAFNLIAQGAQSGLDKDGDLLDSINEYSVHFSNLGLDADDMFNMLKNGAEDGTFSVDKLGDAVKEFGIRVKDGSDTSVAAFESLGLDVEGMAAKFAVGGETAKQALDETVTKLFEMKDPVEQNINGVALFGTQWEDLGASGVEALMGLNGEISTTNTALDDINSKKYDDIGSAMDGLGRQIQTSIAGPLSETLTPMVENLIDYVKENGPAITETIAEIATGVENLIIWIEENENKLILLGAAIGTVTGLVIAFNIQIALENAGLTLWGSIAAGATTVTTGLGAAFGFLTSTMGIAIVAIGAVIAIGVLLYKNWDTVKAKATELGAFISSTFNGLVTSAKEWGINIVSGLWNGITGSKDWIVEKITGFAGSLAKSFTDFFDINSPSGLTELYGKFIDIGLGNGIDKNANIPIASANSLSSAVGTALQKVNDFVSNTVNVIKKEFQLWKLENEELSGSSQELEMQLASQQEQHNLLTEQINVTETALTDMIAKYGEGSTEVLKYKNELLDLQITQAGLTKEIDATTAALNAQQNATCRKITTADSQSSSERSSSRSSYNKNQDEEYNKNESEIKDIASRNNVDLGVAQSMYEKNELDKIIGNVPKYANGTRNHPGGLAWVGEFGKELLNLPTGTQVYSNTESQVMQKPVSLTLSIGTFVGDDLGLKKLERMLSKVRVSENGRLGVENA